MAKKIFLFLLMNVATSGVIFTPSSFADAEVNEGGLDRGRAFYYLNGTAMVNATTVAITLAFYSVIALGIYSLVAEEVTNQMYEFIEVSPVEEAFKVAADAVGIDIEKGSIQRADIYDWRDEYSDEVNKYNTEYEDHLKDKYQSWTVKYGKKQDNILGRPLTHTYRNNLGRRRTVKVDKLLVK